jgi:hypothetical protein
MANDIHDVALTLSRDAYDANYGGKDRSRFLVNRNDLKKILGVSRLHPTKIMELTDACLGRGLILIDMDDAFAFVKLKYVEKWRKLPDRLVNEYVNELSMDEIDEYYSVDSDEEIDE